MIGFEALPVRFLIEKTVKCETLIFEFRVQNSRFRGVRLEFRGSFSVVCLIHLPLLSLAFD